MKRKPAVSGSQLSLVGDRPQAPDGTVWASEGSQLEGIRQDAVYEKKASGKWEPVKSGRRQGPQAPDSSVGQRGKPVGSRHTSPDGTVYEKKASGKWEPVKSGRRQGPQAPDSSGQAGDKKEEGSTKQAEPGNDGSGAPHPQEISKLKNMKKMLNGNDLDGALQILDGLDPETSKHIPQDVMDTLEKWRIVGEGDTVTEDEYLAAKEKGLAE